MKRKDIEIGGIYGANVSGRYTRVLVTAERPFDDFRNRHGGWDAVNLLTGRRIVIKSAQRFRCRAEVPEKFRTPNGAATLKLYMFPTRRRG